MLQGADDWLVRRTQEAYLWAFDRTGIFVASIGMLCLGIMGSFDIAGGDFSKFDVVIYALWIMIYYRRYGLQSDRRYKEFNDEAMRFRSSRTRLFIVCLVVVSIPVLAILHRATLTGLGSMLVALFQFCYLNCVNIRDREPPEKRFAQMATENTP